MTSLMRALPNRSCTALRAPLALSLAMGLVCVAANDARAQYHFPSPAEVVRAVKRGDDNDIDRLAQRLLAMRLLRIVERGQPEERRAALVTIGFADDGWAVATQLVRIAGASPAPEAEAAARALQRQAERWTPLYLETNDVPPDVIAQVAVAIAPTVRRPELASAIRVPLVAAAGRLVELRRLQESDLRPLLNDPDAEVRLAAIDSLRRLPARGLQGLDLVLAGDTDPRVASAAAAAICYDVPPVPTQTIAEARAKQVSQPSRARLRKLATDEAVPLIDRLDFLACLRAFGTPEDQQLLTALSQKGVEALKRRAKSLLGK